MSLLAVILLVVGFALFAFETVRTKSLIAGGLALCALSAVITVWPAGR
jgi:hypothetical protein